ncbi:thiolase family protein [Nocardia fluminea]|uniref:thiolase family protein n=1 Tax=Nocardia fluminea TaxID=134984 RepID=UPI003448530F
MRNVHIAGAAVHPFGKHKNTSATDLGVSAAAMLLADTGVAPEAIQAGFVGSVYGGSLIAQRVLQRVGVSGPPVFTVENACASGGSAVHLAWQGVAAGQYDCVLVVGVDNLSAFGGGTLPLTTADIEIDQGVVMPATYAMRAQRYLYETGATVADLTNVAVKNRGNGARNPRAHLRAAVTAEDVDQSRPIADPLNLFHCCPNSDGAAALLLCSDEFAKDLGRPTTRIRASVVRSGSFHTTFRDMAWPDITERTVTAAYEMSGITPADLDLVELHDAFAVAEFLHAEALGLAERGTAYRAVADGEFALDGRVAVSPSGGLLSRGHPVGATGVSQLAESHWQLTGTAGDLQVSGAEVALTHTTGGGIFGVDNGACSVHIITAEA